MWLKTENFSNACGTSTLKSPLLRAFFTPHVHPRPRKRPPRCTLDCGFKTSESPALRGFEAERCPITGTSLYLVLKSNGLRHSKNPPVRFSFSLKIVPATIAKKLPLQLRPKPLFIAFFSLSHKRPTFAFMNESGYTLGFRRKIAHNGLHGETGAFPPSTTVRLCAASEILFIPPHFYIHTFPGSLWPPTISRREKSAKLPPQLCPLTVSHPDFQLLAQTAHVRFHERKRVHTRLSEKDRTQRLTRRNTGCFGWGRYLYPRTVPHVRKPPRAGYQNGKLCRFLALAGGTPKERREPSEQRCAYACRCSEASRPRWAALLCLQFGDVAVFYSVRSTF